MNENTRQEFLDLINILVKETRTAFAVGAGGRKTIVLGHQSKGRQSRQDALQSQATAKAQARL